MGLFDLDDLLDNIENDDDEFEERPVDLDTFFSSPKYLNQYGVKLSHYQKKMIERMTQIYKRESLVRLYGETKGNQIWESTVKEIICMLGKGSGKDYCAEIACCYLVYKLLCLKDPPRYFNTPPGDSFDIINVAVNADQANNIFFKGMKRLVTNSPYFQALGVDPKMRVIEFPKNITLYSGHSEAGAFEGYNTIMVILDEIAGFEHYPKGVEEEEGVSPAQAIYDMYSASITSRFEETGKLVLLSFPRAKGDFITTAYEEAIGEVQKTYHQHTYVLNPKFPADEPGNSFTIEWSIDEIVRYKKDRVWALRRPSWDVNPTKTLETYKSDFYNEPAKSLGKFAAEPQEAVGGFFDDHDLIRAFSNYNNSWDEEHGEFFDWFKPKEDDTKYYIHVDLARKHDRCVVSMAHVNGWKKASFQGSEEYVPIIKVDLIRTWTPTRSRQIDFADVRDFIVSIVHRGFHLGKVTFDQWQSEEMIKFFNRMGIESEVLSVGLPQYNDLKLIVTERRGYAPFNEILQREMMQLQITKNGKNVDHPRTNIGSKDVSDSVAGAVFNAASLTPKKTAFDFEVLSPEDFKREEAERVSRGLIDPPRAPEGTRMPRELARFLDIELL